MQDVSQMSTEELFALLGQQPPASRPGPTAAPSPAPRQRPAAPVMADMGVSDLGGAITGNDTPEQIAAKMRASGAPESEITSTMADLQNPAGVNPTMAAMTNEELRALLADGGPDQFAPDQSLYNTGPDVVDFDLLPPEMRNTLKAGQRVLMPADAPGQPRQIVTLSQDMNIPVRQPMAGEPVTEFGGGSIRGVVQGNPVEAFATAASEQFPLGDEAVAAVGGLLTGRGFDATRQDQMLTRDLLNRTNPRARDVGGVVGAVAPALLPFGATGSFIGRGGNFANRALRGAAVGTGVGGVYGFTNTDGDFEDRAVGSGQGAFFGGVTGGAIPIAGTTARTVGNFARRSSGQIIDQILERPQNANVAQREAVSALQSALRADGVNENMANRITQEWLQTGVTPNLIDLTPRAGQTQRLLRGAAMRSGPAATSAEGYLDSVANQLQDNAINLTRRLAPGSRPTSDVIDDLNNQITQAAQFDAQTAGSGGRAISERLNQLYDSQKQGVNAAYDAARSAEPERAMVQRAQVPVMAAAVRDAVTDFSMQDVPRVARALDEIDAPFASGNTHTLKGLFDIRSRLTNLRASADPVEAMAASRATRALDGQISEAVDAGRVTGDPEALGLWQSAIAARRNFGQAFEGDDLIANLTERVTRGGARTNAIAGDDASNAILGRSGVSNRQDITRDLARVRDRLGADSAEWRALQNEAVGRVLQDGEGTARFGQKWAAFSRQNPELASIISPPGIDNFVARAQSQIQEAGTNLSQVNAASRIMTTTPDDFSRVLTNERTQGAAARSLEDAIGRPVEGATGVLNRIGTSPNLTRNLGGLFGPAGRNYQDGINYLASQLNNARFVASSTNSQTPGRAVDMVDSIQIPQGMFSGLMMVIDKIRQGIKLTPGESAILLRLGQQPAASSMGLFSGRAPRRLSGYAVPLTSAQMGTTPGRASEQSTTPGP